MKKLMNMILVLSMIIGLLTCSLNKIEAVESLSFVNEYEQVGQEIKLNTDEIEGTLSYIWSVNGKVVSNDESYIPKKEDVNKFIKVVVSNGTKTYEAKTFLSQLPVVYINVENNQAITSKDKYLDSELTIQGNHQYNSETTKLYKGLSEIKGRGNSTWGLPKKPYRLKLDKKTDLFGFGKSKHWVLLANYNDNTFLRNKLGYDLSGQLDVPYMQSVLVDVVLNGQYIGNYQLCEHIRIDEERIDITDWESIAEDIAACIVDDYSLSEDDLGELEELMVEDLSWISSDEVSYNGQIYKVSDSYEYLDITGGYLMEIDKNYDEVSKFHTKNGMPVMFKSPEFANTNNDMMNYVKSYIEAFEDAVKSKDYTIKHENKIKHYSELFDIKSLIDVWLVQELFLNADFMKNSTYLYKNHDELFKMGPVWDLDWTSGVEYSSSTDYSLWQTIAFNNEGIYEQWYKYLVKDPYFIKLVQDRYLEIRDTYIKDMYESIDIYANEIKDSAQASLDMWKNGKSFSNEIHILKTWMNNRLSFLDSKMNDYTTLLNEFNDSLNLLSVSDHNHQSLVKDDVYDYCVDSGSHIYISDTTEAKSVDIWNNNRKIDTVLIENGKIDYDLVIDENSVIRFIYTYDNNETSVSYASIAVNEKTIKDIEFIEPSQTTYYLNEELNMSDAKFIVHYDDQSSEVITSYDISGYDKNKVGKQIVTLTYKGFSTSFEVEVLKREADISFDVGYIEMNVGDVVDLKYSVIDKDEKVYFSVEDEDIVKVIDNKVIGLNNGTTVIKAYLDNGHYDECIVKVNGSFNNEVISITLDKDNVELKVNETLTLNATVLPDNATDKSVTWTSSNPKVATVKDGVVTALKAGTTTITVTTTSNGLTATCKVTVLKDCPFTDVSNKQWYYGVISEAYQLGLMTGATDTLFKPNANMNRGMVAIVFHRMEGRKKVEFSSIFPDVAKNQYYTTSVLWAKQTGVINGYKDGTFKPTRNVSREEMATMIYNFARYKGLDMSASKDITYFDDYNKITPYAVGPLQWAVEKGLMSGKLNGTKLDPLGTATRAECSKMLVELYKLIY